MIPKAPNVKYEVFLTSFGYTCGATDTLEKAIKIAKKTGFQCPSSSQVNEWIPLEELERETKTRN